MRRVLAAAALSLSLLTVAGCSGSDGSDAGSAGASATGTASAGPGASGAPGASGGPGASAGGPAAAGSPTGADKQVCEEVARIISASTRRFGEEMGKALQAGDEKATAAAVKTLFAEWAAGIRGQQGRTANPALKSALTDYASALDKVIAQLDKGANIEAVDSLDSPEVRAATDKVTAVCG